MTSADSYNRRRTAAIAYLCMFFEGGSTMLLSAAKQPIMSLYGIGIAEFSLVLTIRSIVCGVMPFFCGGLSDRLGRKKVIVFGMVLFLLYYLMVPQVPVFAVLIISISGLAVGYSLVDPTSQALLFDCYENPTHQVVFIQVAFAAGGMAIPFLVSGLLGNGMPFQISFWLWLAYCAFIMVYVLLQKFPRIPGKSPEKAEKMEGAFAFAHSWIREGASIFFFTILNNIVNSAIATYADLYEKTVFQMSDANAVRVLSYYQAGCVIGSLISAKLVMKFHPAKLIVLETAFASVSMLLAMLSGNGILFTICLFAVGLGTGVQFSLCIGLAGEMFWKNTGAAAGAVSSASAIGIALASVLGGTLIGSAGIRVYYWVVAGACVLELISGIIVFVLYERLRGRSFKRNG